MDNNYYQNRHGGIQPAQPSQSAQAQNSATSPSVVKEPQSRMSPGQRNRIMVEQMRRLGIARANAAYYASEFAQNMTADSAISGNTLRVLNAYLNEAFDEEKAIDTKSVVSHRTARSKMLVGDIAMLVSKKSLVPLVQALMLAAIDPAEVEKAVRAISASRSQTLPR